MSILTAFPSFWHAGHLVCQGAELGDIRYVFWPNGCPAGEANGIQLYLTNDTLERKHSGFSVVIRLSALDTMKLRNQGLVIKSKDGLTEVVKLYFDTFFHEKPCFFPYKVLTTLPPEYPPYRFLGSYRRRTFRAVS